MKHWLPYIFKLMKTDVQRLLPLTATNIRQFCFQKTSHIACTVLVKIYIYCC